MTQCATTSALRQHENDQDRGDRESIIINQMARDILIDEMEPLFDGFMDDIDKLAERWEYFTRDWNHVPKDMCDELRDMIKKDMAEEARLIATKRFDEGNI